MLKNIYRDSPTEFKIRQFKRPRYKSVDVYMNGQKLSQGKHFMLKDGSVEFLIPVSGDIRISGTVDTESDLYSDDYGPDPQEKHFLDKPKNVKYFNQLPGSNHFGSKRKKGKNK